MDWSLRKEDILFVVGIIGLLYVIFFRNADPIAIQAIGTIIALSIGLRVNGARKSKQQ